jgi:hypothetical protein
MTKGSDAPPTWANTKKAQPALWNGRAMGLLVVRGEQKKIVHTKQKSETKPQVPPTLCVMNVAGNLT